MLWIQARAAGTSASCKNARSADEQLVLYEYSICLLCLFACPNFIGVIRDFKRIFNVNINYTPYVILSKQVCFFEFRIYKSFFYHI